MAEISIIVPIYQAEKTLNRCIDSILAQIYTDFELLLIDDGSTDNSPLICDEYAKKDSRIKVIHKENAGVSAARNTGIEQATSKYVMFCDSDDEVMPNWCEVLFELIAGQENTMAMCNVSKSLPIITPNQSSQTLHSYFEVWKTGVSAYTVNKLFRLDIIKENNIRFDPSVQFAEDVVFISEYYRFIDKTIYTDMELYIYYDNAGSLMKHDYYDFFPVFSIPFLARLELFSKEELGLFCDSYLYSFIGMLNIVFARNDPKGFLKKILFNHKIVSSKAFQTAVRNATGKNESKLIIFLLKTRLYLPYYLAMKFINRNKKKSEETL